MKQNEQVLEAWLQMTTVINNERITPDLPYNESMICRYLYQNQDIKPLLHLRHHCGGHADAGMPHERQVPHQLTHCHSR